MLLLYFDRVAERTTPKLLISSLTVHRLVIASITVASKALCDNYYTNAYYAKVRSRLFGSHFSDALCRWAA